MSEPISEEARKPGLDDLGPSGSDVVGHAVEGDTILAGIPHDTRRSGITVARLPHAPHIDDTAVAGLQRDLAKARKEANACLGGDPHSRPVGVADEAESRLKCVKCLLTVAGRDEIVPGLRA